MKTWLAALCALPLACSALVAPAAAQTRCHTDAAGATMCRDADGGWVRGHTDADGNSIWRDSRGGTVVGRETSQGDAIYRDGRGNTVVGHTDAQGNTVLRGNDGAVAVGRTEPAAPRGPAPTGPVHCRSFNHGLSTCP